MINCLIVNDKIALMDSSITKINDKIAKEKSKNPKSRFIVKSYCDSDFRNSFEGSRKVLREYLEKCLVIKEFKC